MAGAQAASGRGRDGIGQRCPRDGGGRNARATHNHPGRFRATRSSANFHGVRCFIAINLPAAVRDAVATQTAPLRLAAPRESWVTAERLHATVRFLGEVEPPFVAQLGVALNAAARRVDPIPLEIATLGAFPVWKRARVIWAGVGYDPKLELLHHDIETACIALGLDVEGRPFRPHVTLARLREPGGEVARAIFQAARGIRIHHAMSLDSIDIMQSTLTPTGPTYERLAAIPLGRSR